MAPSEVTLEQRTLPTERGVTVQKIRSPNGFDVYLVGASRFTFGDWYHLFLKLSWPAALGLIAGVYLLANATFAVMFVMVGGVANLMPTSLPQAFFFSVQTMGAIGYGAMYPEGLAAHLLVVAESVVALVINAVATGLLFARFTRITSKVQFTTHAVIGPMDGVPTLSIRVGNERRNAVLDAHVSMAVTRRETTAEGVPFYRNYDLALLRDRNFALTRTWTVMHAITPDSPLHGLTAQDLEEQELEINVFLRGTDDTTHQPVFAKHGIEARNIRFGARHADVLALAPDGRLMVDVRRFDQLEDGA